MPNLVPRPTFRALRLLLIVGGSLALVWAGVSLQGIFIEERDAAKQAIETRQQALQQYARIALERQLRSKLDNARARIDAALADPLLETHGLLFIDNGQQQLPRKIRYRQGDETPAKDLYQALERGRVTGEGPWGERLALLAELRRAIESADHEAITAYVRDWLNHQPRYVLPIAQDLPFRLHLVELLVHGTSPSPSLLKALLRDGLLGSRGRRIEGLQPTLLSHRERFTQTDFDFLATKLTALSRDARVVHDDFEAHVSADSAPQVQAPKKLSAPALIAGGTWYAAPLELQGMRGVAVELAQELQQVGAEMREAGLIEQGDALTLKNQPAEGQAVFELPLWVRSSSLREEARQIDSRYSLKTGIGVALFCLIAGVALLSVLLYWRERRFLERQARFVATVSHELRTPIASLRLMGETLERRLAGVESARDFPSRIVGEAERLGFLVENILSFNRLEKATVSSHRHELSFAELWEGIEVDARSFTGKPLHLRLASGEDLRINVDPDLVKLLLQNLVNNACKYNQRDQIEIMAEASEQADHVALRVTDNGTGIPKREWDSVFTEFVRASSSGNSRGFGLGLALCRRIMKLHDGEIYIAQSTDAGTTFEMIFPSSKVKPNKRS